MYKTSRTANLILIFLVSLLNLAIVYNRYGAFKRLQSVEKYSENIP